MRKSENSKSASCQSRRVVGALTAIFGLLLTASAPLPILRGASASGVNGDLHGARFECAGSRRQTERREQIVAILQPTGGDDLAQVREALHRAEVMAVEHSDLLPKVLLAAGTFYLSEPVSVHNSHLIVEGAGSDDSGTRIVRTAGDSADAVWLFEPSQTEPRTNPGVAETEVCRIAESIVPVGAREFSVENPTRLRQGQRVRLEYPATAKWLASINNGATGGDRPLRAGGVSVTYYRVITAIHDDRVVVDAPVFYELNREFSVPRFVSNRTPYIENVTLRGMHLVAKGGNATGKNWSRVGVRFSAVENALVQNVIVENHAISGIELTGGCKNISVIDCTVRNPLPDGGKGRGYGFRTKEAQLILFRNCAATGCRYGYTCSGGPQDSGIVLQSCRASGSTIASFACTAVWCHGILLDNFVDDSPAAEASLVLGNCRGDAWDRQGWTCVNSVAWRCDTKRGSIIVDQPPTAWNSMAGCSGSLVIDGTARTTGIAKEELAAARPKSLFDAQVEN